MDVNSLVPHYCKRQEHWTGFDKGDLRFRTTLQHVFSPIYACVRKPVRRSEAVKFWERHETMEDFGKVVRWYRRSWSLSLQRHEFDPIPSSRKHPNEWSTSWINRDKIEGWVHELNRYDEEDDLWVMNLCFLVCKDLLEAWFFSGTESPTAHVRVVRIRKLFANPI